MGWCSRGLVLAGLAVVGAPFTSGALGKYATKTAVEGVSLWGLDLVHLLPFVATGSTVLLVRFMWLLMHTEADPLPAGSDPELPAWTVIVLTSLVLPWWVAAAWLPITAVPGLDPVTLWGATWPVLVGLAASAVVWRRASAGLRDRVRQKAQQVSAGDLLVFEERALAWVTDAAGPVGDRFVEARDRAVADVRSGWRGARRRGAGPLRSAARTIESYRGSGVVLLVLLVVFVLVQGVGS